MRREDPSSISSQFSRRPEGDFAAQHTRHLVAVAVKEECCIGGRSARPPRTARWFLSRPSVAEGVRWLIPSQFQARKAADRRSPSHAGAASRWPPVHWRTRPAAPAVPRKSRRPPPGDREKTQVPFL